ncbi:MAG TPA: hypothetical protein VK753_09310 [Xanthomonadaceae bacterium]|nr:hypothetical protein [Xanthomonadaceae bacterium]
MGIGHHFTCANCARKLSVSKGWKAAYVGILILGVTVCGSTALEERSDLPYLGIPAVMALATLVVCRYAVIQLAERRRGLFSLFNLGVLGMVLYAADYATSM